MRSGRCVTVPGIRICALPNQIGVTRVACIAGKKVDRSAVSRHRIQRWLRVVARAMLKEVPAGQGYDMVWLARSDVKQYTSARQLGQGVSQHMSVITSRLFNQVSIKG